MNSYSDNGHHNRSSPHASTDGRTWSNTFVPLSRGWREHLPKLSGNAVKLYILLLIDARFSGANKGKVAANFKDLAQDLALHRTSVMRAAQELRPHYITWDAAKNQHDVTVFTIQRYKTASDFSSGAAASPKNRVADSNSPPQSCASATMQPACGQHVSSIARKSKRGFAVTPSNNGKNDDNREYTISSPLLRETYQRITGRAWQHDWDSFLRELISTLEGSYPNPNEKTVAWAFQLVGSRAKTRPQSFAYFQRSLPRVFANLSLEVEGWLIVQAKRLQEECSGDVTLGDLAETLKQLAAEYHLPYDSGQIDCALNKAQIQIEVERRLVSERAVGRFNREARV